VTTDREAIEVYVRDEEPGDDAALDLLADLSAMDDDGKGWSLLRDADNPS